MKEEHENTNQEKFCSKTLDFGLCITSLVLVILANINSYIFYLDDTYTHLSYYHITLQTISIIIYCVSFCHCLAQIHKNDVSINLKNYIFVLPFSLILPFFMTFQSLYFDQCCIVYNYFGYHCKFDLITQWIHDINYRKNKISYNCTSMFFINGLLLVQLFFQVCLTTMKK